MGGELPSLVLSSSCGAEQSGGAEPPISPEVIVILLILRRLRLTDAPSEHFSARELYYVGKLSTSILFIPLDGSRREVSSEGQYELPRRSDAKHPEKFT